MNRMPGLFYRLTTLRQINITSQTDGNKYTISPIGIERHSCVSNRYDTNTAFTCALGNQLFDPYGQRGQRRRQQNT